MMRIHDTNRLGMIQSYQKMGQMIPEKNNIQKKQQKDQVEISSQGQEKLKQIREDHVNRQERLIELKQQVELGSYKVDSGKVAEKLLSYLKNTQR